MVTGNERLLGERITVSKTSADLLAPHVNCATVTVGASGFSLTVKAVTMPRLPPAKACTPCHTTWDPKYCIALAWVDL